MCRTITRVVNRESTPGEGSFASVGVLTEKIPNPEYEAWVALDQLILGWIYNSITQAIAIQVMEWVFKLLKIYGLLYKCSLECNIVLKLTISNVFFILLAKNSKK